VYLEVSFREYQLISLIFFAMVIVLFVVQITYFTSQIVVLTEYSYLIGPATIVAVPTHPFCDGAGARVSLLVEWLCYMLSVKWGVVTCSKACRNGWNKL